MDIRTTYLAEIIHRAPSDLGYCDTSDVGADGVWSNPNEDGVNMVWRVQWP